MEQISQNNLCNISIPALGRVHSIGALFDKCREDFLGANMVPYSLIKDFLTVTDSPDKRLEWFYAKTNYDKFNHLGVHFSLSLPILGNLITLGGSGKYLKENSRTMNKHEMVLKIYCPTYNERIDNMAKIRSLLNYTKLKNLFEISSHFVNEIDYGYCIIASFSLEINEDYTNDFFNTEIGLKIKTLIVDISCGVKIEIADKYKDFMKKIRVKIYSDIPFETYKIIMTIEDFSQYISQLPSKIKKSKGIPLQYKLIDLNFLIGNLNIKIIRILNNVEESTYMKISNIIEQFDDEEFKIDSLIQIADQIEFKAILLNEKELLNTKKQKLKSKKFMFVSKIHELLVEFRKGKIDLNPILEILKNSYDYENYIDKSLMKRIDLYNIFVINAKKIKIEYYFYLIKTLYPQFLWTMIIQNYIYFILIYQQ